MLVVCISIILLLDKFYFNSSSPIVIDSSTEKKRKSIVRTGNTWKPSLLEASINCGYINSSPGRKNNFKEFLEKNQLTGNWKLNSPTGNIPDYIFLTAKTYPEITKTFTIYKNGNNEFNLTNLIYEFPENSLIYFGTSIGDESYLNLSNLFISKVNPYPENSQDEWIMICNYSNNSIPVKSLEIKDENSFDEIIPFGQRFPDLRGYSVSLNLNPFNEFLGPKQCAYIVDPDANISLLNDISSFTNLILTVKDTGIGNGISPDEKLDLFQKIDSYRIHLASYGNQYSNSPFVWKTKKGEIIYLKPGKEGYNPEDYSIE